MGSIVLPILGALAGAFNKQKTTSDTTSNSTTTPNYNPATLAFKNQLMSLFTNNLNSLPTQDQFKTAGVKNIQDQSDNAQASLQDILATHGLSRTTAGGTSAFDTSYKQGQGISNFLTNAPFNYQTAIQPSLSNASGFLSSLPIGTTTSGSSHTVGTGGPTSPIAGAITGGASALAGVLGQQQAQTSLGNILKSLGQSGGGSSGNSTYGDGTVGWPSYTSSPSTVTPGNYSNSGYNPGGSLASAFSAYSGSASSPYAFNPNMAPGTIYDSGGGNLQLVGKGSPGAGISAAIDPYATSKITY